MKRKLVITAAVLSIGAFLLGGCTNQDETSPQPTAEATATEQGANEVEPKRAYPEYGGTYNWENGISISVSEPTKIAGPTESSAGEGENLAFLVTIENQSQEQFDPNLTTFGLTADGTLAEQIFDPANGLDEAPRSTIPAGEDGEFLVGFNVANQTDMAFEVTPGNSTGNSILFTE